VNYIHHYQSPIGNITVASDGSSLIGLWFDGQKYFADTITRNTPEKQLPIFDLSVISVCLFSPLNLSHFASQGAEV